MYYYDQGLSGWRVLFIVLLIIELIVWGIAGGYIAFKRGRNPFLWFLLTFGGLWFSLIVLMLLPPIGGKYKKCQACAEMVGIEAYVCPHCQYSFYSAPHPTAEENIHMCPGCGTRIEEGFEICPNCGKILRFRCGKCGRDTKVEWTTCPQCGNSLRP